jgi:CheY-like chemotaxis protein/pSer/pThr/pTyr-binding forkhead associated (FHA) protein
MPTLRIKLPDNKGEITHVLAGDRITVGRRPDNTIQIIDRTVSAHHAELIGSNGHYRLHDLGSTNLTCVNGQPITDFHLHESCKVNFGTVECEFSPETPVATTEKSEVVPTRSELEFLRRENLDLEAKIAAMQKQVDILSSARLMTKDTQQLGVMPEVHKRVQQERDELRNENGKLKFDVDSLRNDVNALIRERDALRLAWETVKRERDEVMTKLTTAGIDAGTVPTESPKIPEAKIGSGIIAVEASNGAAKGAADHRAMATVLTKVPPALRLVQGALEAVSADGNNRAAAQHLVNEAVSLVEVLQPIAGHPAHRLANACVVLIKDARSRVGRIEPTVAVSLQQAMETLGGMLDPRIFKKAEEAPTGRTLIVDDDKELLGAVESALRLIQVGPSTSPDPAKALDILAKESFDLVLLDIGMQGINGFEVCGKIRALPAHKKTPVLFMTGSDSVDNRVNSCISGGNDFIVKPFNVQHLVVKAATWIYRHQLGLKFDVELKEAVS